MSNDSLVAEAQHEHEPRRRVNYARMARTYFGAATLGAALGGLASFALRDAFAVTLIQAAFAAMFVVWAISQNRRHPDLVCTHGGKTA